MFHTGLTADRFADYFAEFCARSYHDEVYEFSELQAEQYFEQLKERKKDNGIVTCRDFLDDLTGHLCLLYYDDGKYHFIHRSFQEYFCAVYFSKQKDRTLKYIGEFFENNARQTSADNTFGMLYDMIPEKVEEYIFEPFLTDVLKECTGENGYQEFLKRLYPSLCYETGCGRKKKDAISYAPANSFLYNSMLQAAGISGISASFLSERYREWKYEMLHRVYFKASAPEILTGTEFVMLSKDHMDPEEYRRNTKRYRKEAKLEDILLNPQQYHSAWMAINGKRFPLKQEYTAVMNYLKKLQTAKPAGEINLFDLF